MNFKNETFSLYKAFVSVRNYLHYMDHVLSSNEITHIARHKLTFTKKRGDAILNDFKMNLGEDALKEFEREIESDTMVYDAMWDMVAQLDEKGRWDVEEYIKHKIKNKHEN